MNMKGRGKYIWSVVALFVIFLGIFLGWPIYFSIKTKPMAEALALMPLAAGPRVVPGSNGGVKVSIENGAGTLDFRTGSSNGVIFYPGAFIDPRVYAPALLAIAQKGIDVVLVPMPLGLAPLSPERALGVIKARPDIKHWILGGHSAGGASAVSCVLLHGNRFVGTFCWASPVDPTWANLAVPGFGVWSTEDAWLKDKSTPAWVDGHTGKNFTSVFLEGGNHGQFGYMGPMPRDNDPKLSRDEQVRLAVAHTTTFLTRIFYAQTN